MDLMLAVAAEIGGFEVCHAGSRKRRHRQHMGSHDFVHAHRQPCLRKQLLCNQSFQCQQLFIRVSEIILPLTRSRA